VGNLQPSLIVISTLAISGCYPVIKATGEAPPTAKELAELWSDPGTGRDLFDGPGGARLAPDPSATYTLVEKKLGGFSLGYTVMDPSEREWSIKLYPEAHTEVVYRVARRVSRRRVRSAHCGSIHSPSEGENRRRAGTS
jgi:hypothetical protein